MRRFSYYIIILLVFLPITSAAQAKVTRNKILDRRLKGIEYFHVGIGIDAAMNKNYKLSPKVFMGLGSNRNVFNVDLGLKLSLSNIFGKRDDEYIRYYSFPIFVAVSINAFRRRQKSLYLGAEIAYNIALGSSHIVNNQMSEIDAISISNNHFTYQVKLGYRIIDLDFSVYYENDLSPAINQKYVYESPAYNYFKIYESILERWRIGLSATYNFRF